MSDTAAFIAGCAVSGVAALFLMKNGFAGSQSGSPRDYVSPAVPALSPSPTPNPNWVARDPSQDWRMETRLDQQRNTAEDLSKQLMQQQNATENLQNRTEDLKGWITKQDQQTETLRNQLEQQQRTTEQLLSQLQDQQRLLDRMASDRSIEQAVRPLAPTPKPSPSEEEKSKNWFTVILWIVGGVVLVIVVGGGLLLIAIILVVVLSRRRPPRTVHVVHPAMPQYFAHQPQALPPTRVRMVSPRQYDYYDE